MGFSAAGPRALARRGLRPRRALGVGSLRCACRAPPPRSPRGSAEGLSGARVPAATTGTNGTLSGPPPPLIGVRAPPGTGGSLHQRSEYAYLDAALDGCAAQQQKGREGRAGPPPCPTRTKHDGCGMANAQEGKARFFLCHALRLGGPSPPPGCRVRQPGRRPLRRCALFLWPVMFRPRRPPLRFAGGQTVCLEYNARGLQ